MRWSGLYTALITPFNGQGVDFLSLKQLIALHNTYSDGLVVLGSTAEAFSLTPTECEKIVDLVACEATIPYLVGCCSVSLDQALEKASLAKKYQADGLMLAPVAYLKPNEASLTSFFMRVAEHSTLPTMLYNIPSRTGVELSLSLLETLFEKQLFVALKETNLTRLQALIELKKKYDFMLFSGEDTQTLEVMQQGGDGVVSVVGNLLLEPLKKTLFYASKKQWSLATQHFAALTPVFEALKLDANPVVIKKAMQLLELPSSDPRAPLLPLNKADTAVLTQLISLWKKSPSVS